MSKKQFKDVFTAPEEGVVPASVQNVDKTASGAVTVESDVVIVNGSASKSALYGNGEAFTAVGYAGSGSVKSVAGLQIGEGTEASAVTVGNNLSAKVVAGAKYEFSKEEAKNPLTGFESTVEIAKTDVTVLDAKVTDAFAGAVMTDTATSKKFTDKYSVVVDDADIKVVGGTVTNVYGGGTGALSYVKDANIYISGGKVTNVYAGGLDGAVVGDANIYVDLNSGAAASAMSIGTIYAGGKNANLFGDVVVTVTTNGAVGSNGKINKIVGTPAGKGVVYGTRELYLDAYQGDFTASVVAMDKVVIASDSAVTFTKAQDKSMKNAEYVLEVSEADNSNQAAILTLKSAYNINKLTVAVADNLITEGGSFSRTLIAGVKGKFNSTTFDADKVNVAKDNGNLIADYQYDLSFETVTDAKGKETETGKLIFTYTGADLKVSVDGYTNRYGVANVLSSADDVVTFVKKDDLMGGTTANGTITDKVIDFDFKTMGGDDEVVIEDDVYFTGKLALGAGNDTVTINGTLSYLELTGENTVIVNGMLDARGIKTDADSKNTFVLNGSFQSTTIDTDTTLGTTIKQTFYYEDGSWTEDGVDKKKKLVYAETSVTDINGYVTVTKTPFIGNAKDNVEVDRWIESLTQTATHGLVQDLTLTKGDNTVIVEAAGVGDITLAGKAATVALNDDNYNGEIDLRSAATSTLIIDANVDMANLNFTGSRIGKSNIVVAKDITITDGAQLDLKYGKAKLEIKDAVTLTVDGKNEAEWNDVAVRPEDIDYGYNAVLKFDDAELMGNYSGYKVITTPGQNLKVYGAIDASYIEFSANDFTAEEVKNSTVILGNSNNIAWGAVTNSDITVEGTLASFVIDGNVSNSEIVFDGVASGVTFDGREAKLVVDADSVVEYIGAIAPAVDFYGDVDFAGTLNVGGSSATLNFEKANVTFANEFVTSEYIYGFGMQNGSISMNLTYSNIVVAGEEISVENLAIDGNSTISGAGSLVVNGSLSLAGDYKFDGNQSIKLTDEASVDIDGDVVLGAGYDMTADVTVWAFSSLTGTKTTAEDGSVTYSKISGDVDLDGWATLKDVEVKGELTLNPDAMLAGNVVAKNATVIGMTTLADGAVVDLGVVEDADFFVDDKYDADGNVMTEDGVATIKATRFDGEATIAGDAVVIDSGDGVLEVINGDLILGVNSFTGDVRVYGFEGIDNPYDVEITADIKLDGAFEADVNVNPSINVTMTADSKIWRDNVEVPSLDAYGALNFTDNGAGAASILTAEVAEEGKAFVQNGVNAVGDLVFRGAIKADFTVGDELVMGTGKVDADYVIKDSEAVAAEGAAIEGNVVANTLTVNGASSVSGNIDAGTIAVSEGNSLTAGSITVGGGTALSGNITVGTLAVKNLNETTKIADAVLSFGDDKVKVTGAAITMDATATNVVTLSKDQNLGTTALNFSAANAVNTLNVKGSATVDTMTVASGKLTLNVNQEFLLDEEGNPDPLKPYAEFKSNIALSDGGVDGVADVLSFSVKDHEGNAVNGVLNMADKTIDFKGNKIDEFGVVTADSLIVEADDTLIVKEIKGAELNITGEVIGNVTASKLDIQGNVTGAVTVDKMKLDNGSYKGAISVKDLTVDGNATAIDAGLAPEKLTLDGGSLTIQKMVDRIDPETGEVVKDLEGNVIQDPVADEFAGTLNVFATTSASNGINAAKVNGDINVSGILDDKGKEKNVAAVKLNTEVTGAVKFNNMSLTGESEVVGNFSANDIAGQRYVADGAFELVGGQVTQDGVLVDGILGNTLTIGNDVVVAGNIELGAGADILNIVDDATVEVAKINFGKSEFCDVTKLTGIDKAGEEYYNLFFDKIVAEEKDLFGTDEVVIEADKIEFAQDLSFGDRKVINSQDIVIDRDAISEEIVKAVNESFKKSLTETVANVTIGEKKSIYTVKASNGLEYKVTIQYIGAGTADALKNIKPSDYKVTVENYTDTVVATADDAHIVEINAVTSIDGSVKLGSKDDVVVLNKDLTLNKLSMGGFQLGATMNGEGKWTVDDVNTADVDMTNSNVLDFGTGSDTINIAAGAILTAAKVLVDTLTISGEAGAADKTIDAVVAGNKVVVDTDDVKITELAAKEVVANQSFTAEKISGAATISLNRTITYKDNGEDADTVEATAAVEMSDFKVGNGTVTVANNFVVVPNDKLTADLDTIELTANTDANVIGNITGSTEEIDEVETKVSNLVINSLGNNTVLSGAANTVKDLAKLTVGSVSGLATLEIAGTVEFTGNISDVDDVTLQGNATVNGISVENVNKLVVSEKAKLTADVNGTDKADKFNLNSESVLTGNVNFESVQAVLEGSDVAADRLMLGNGSSITGNVTFGLAEVADAGEVAGKAIVSLSGVATVGSITFEDKNGEITGTGTLTGSVNFVEKLVLGSSVTGTITGGSALADDALFINKAGVTVGALDSVEAIKFEMTVANGQNIFDLTAGTAEIDLASLIDGGDMKALKAGDKFTFTCDDAQTLTFSEDWTSGKVFEATAGTLTATLDAGVVDGDKKVYTVTIA